MTRDEFVKKTLGYQIRLAKLHQEYFETCYLSADKMHQLFPHGAKVKVLPTGMDYYTRFGRTKPRSDPYKLVGEIGTIDLTFNVYSEAYINVRFPISEKRTTEEQRLVYFNQLVVIE